MSSAGALRPHGLACGRCRGSTASGSSPRQQRAALLRCRAAGERDAPKPVFSLDDRPNTSLNMADIMDAYEVCSLIPDPNERHQCYSVFGLDAKRMAAYYETVVSLEHQLGADIDSPAAAPPSPWHALAQHQHRHHAPAITRHTPPPPAAAAAVALAMFYIAAQHLAFF